MTDTDPDEVMAAVSRRSDVLEAVGAGGVHKRDLVASLDVSRSTVDRATRELEGTGLVERTKEGFRRTLAGELALREYARFADRVGGIIDSRSILAGLSARTPFDASMLVGAECVPPERHTPNLPVTRLSELIERAERVRGFAPAVFPQQVDTYRSGIVDRGIDVELLLSESVVERLVSSYPEDLSAALETGRLSMRIAADPLPYSLTVVETPSEPMAGLLVYADDGNVKGFVGNDDPAAVDWALGEFQRRWERGTPVPLPRDG